jgi:hypothetical protein
MNKKSPVLRTIIQINALVWVGLALALLVYPPVRVALDLRDPALQGPGTPRVAWRLFRSLTPRYEEWARKRVTEGRAEGLATSDISGTEWPLFGSVFYLWAAQNLESAWQSGDHSSGVEPKVFAKGAILAASELVIDPKHAAWVKKHWGEDYLHRQNVFYRMLVIASLTAREELCQDGTHRDLLKDQVESLAQELDSSKRGLLDDYPGECYPGDVMAAWMCIQRADSVLGTDHSQMIGRALRAFVGVQSTRYGLPPYSASSGTGRPTSDSRGCANSYMCLTAPELWGAEARRWYALYDRFFWQERFGAKGYREFPPTAPHSNWTTDVDAGPVVAGFGVAANAFGVGAARKNGRFDRAYPLASELLATVWILPNGALAVPRLLSNLSDAPLLGEAGILWQLTIQPQKGFPIKTGGSLPTYVYVLLIGTLVIGLWRILESVVALRQADAVAAMGAKWASLQVVLWIGLLLATLVAFFSGHGLVGLAALVAAAILPLRVGAKKPKGVEDWPESNLPPNPTATEPS